MKIRTTLRHTIAALALASVGLGAFALSGTTAASASTLSPPVVVSVLGARLSVTNVTVYDYNNISRNYNYTPNPYTWVNPTAIYGGDWVAVCATVTNSGFLSSSPTAITVKGPNYNWAGTVPAVTSTAPQTVCTGYYQLNFSGAVGNCQWITLNVQVGTSTKAAPSFSQTDLCHTYIN